MKKRKTPESEELSLALGERIAKLRQQREWTQQQVSDQANGLERAFISRIEAGQVEPCLGTLSALAKAFSLTLSELLKGVGSKRLVMLLLIACLPVWAQTRKTPIEIQCAPSKDDSVGPQLCSALRDILAASPRYEEVPHNPTGYVLKILTVACVEDHNTAFSSVLLRGPIYLDGSVQTCDLASIRRCAQEEFAHQDEAITIITKVTAH